jgi:UDP-glucose 4-epimerase
VLNCGYGRGFTVREVIDSVRRVSGVDFPVVETERRAGDPPELVADSTRLREQFGWRPEHDDLDEIVKTALNWERREAESVS